MNTQAGPRHELAEFTAEDVGSLVARGPSLRQPEKPRVTTPEAKPSQ
jgi:hypothetical protein